jgi:hypothetical protein
MPPFPRANIVRLLRTASHGTTPRSRGRALERAAVQMFSSVPGVLTPVTNIVDYAAAGEIDILFPNKALDRGLWFLHRAFVCECKNWSAPIGAQDVCPGCAVRKDGVRGRGCRLDAGRITVKRAIME